MRRAGILLPIFSLPSPYGIGTVGQAARDFLDFLAAAGQSAWQILPIGPTSFGDSPYQSFSSFAGNPYFIDLDDLAEDGLLKREEYARLNWGSDPVRVDYGTLYEARFPVLRTACRRLLAAPPADYHIFVEQNIEWLEDYTLFMALKDRFGGRAWHQWPDELRLREPAAMAEAKTQLAEDISFWQGVQYLFFRQWNALKKLASEKGISIIGDLPIYVSPDSADVWANPEQFALDEDLTPIEVAGCPPDGFTEDGQLWGNPLFNWKLMKEQGYRWWIRRIDFQFRLYDVLRIDHFRGFDEFYAIPYGHTTARHGTWRPGPGKDFFRAVNEALGPRNIIAEDLGFLTESVKDLLASTGYPGMKLLQFATDPDGSYIPHQYPRNCVVYPGTHDNDTVLGWLDSLPDHDRDFVTRYFRLNEPEGFHRGMIRSAWATVADLAIIPVHDLLGLGSEARINIPSTTGCNWLWRLLPGQLTDGLARSVREDMAVYRRLPFVK